MDGEDQAEEHMEITQEGEKSELVKESKDSLENVGTLGNGASEGSKMSYKDRLMNDGLGKLNPYEIVEMVTEDYISDEDSMEHMEESQTPFNPNPVIEVSLEEYDEWCRPWKQALIVKPLGKNLNLQTMERWINRRWTKKEAVHVMDLVRGYFLVRFSNQEDYSHALFKGPWMIADHYLLVQRWRPLFIPQESEVKRVAVWIRIPNLPAKLYNRYFLWKVGKSIGNMLKVEEHTSIHSREKFAHICVEVDLRKKMVPSFSTLGKDFRLEYKDLHLICFNCGRYGHKHDGCPKKIKEAKDKPQSQAATDEQNHQKGENGTAVQG
ncbi:uncharacterized protein LOC130981296 [Arachis stenosperma]|uniref:uncharacterized protein LOC130981296 n=1 Tax=Arachis stenosperma TaxID=217475 RepID=UPI0025AC1C6E|nr:uncharacterized protein LOC130981296 [Arachis stenosperma]